MLSLRIVQVCVQQFRLSVLRCVEGEDKVASFDRLVAGKTGFVQRLVGRFAVIELREPAAVAAYFFESLTIN
jgi:hypothetical protein